MADHGPRRGPLTTSSAQAFPAHTQPGHHVADGSEELRFLLLRIGVIKAQKTDPIVGLGEAQLSVSAHVISSHSSAPQTRQFSELSRVRTGNIFRSFTHLSVPKCRKRGTFYTNVDLREVALDSPSNLDSLSHLRAFSQ